MSEEAASLDRSDAVVSRRPSWGRRSGVTVAAVVRALRPQYLLFEIGPIAIGTALVLAVEGTLDALTAIAAAAAIVLIGQASEPWNEYFDWRTGADRFDRKTVLSGGSGVLARGELSPRGLLLVASVTFAVGCVIGVILVVSQPALIPIGAAGCFLAVAYSAPPFRLRYRGLGELAMALGKGLLIVAAVYQVQTGSISAECILLGSGYGLIVASFMQVKVFGRYESDIEREKVTLLHLTGRRRGIITYAALFALAYLSLAADVALFADSPWPLLPVATAPFVAVIVRTLKREPYMRDQIRFAAMMRWVIVATNGYALLLALGLLLDRA